MTACSIDQFPRGDADGAVARRGQIVGRHAVQIDPSGQGRGGRLALCQKAQHQPDGLGAKAKIAGEIDREQRAQPLGGARAQQNKENKGGHQHEGRRQRPECTDDPRQPIVLGMCHSSAKPAPEPAKDDNHHKGYVSREKLKMTYDDDKKSIAFETPGGNKLTLSDDTKGIQLEDQNGNKITLDDKGITIESTKAITLKATKDLKAEGMNIEMKAKTGFKAEGTASAEISGASTTVKGSANTVIKGGVVQIN